MRLGGVACLAGYGKNCLYSHTPPRHEYIVESVEAEKRPAAERIDHTDWSAGDICLTGGVAGQRPVLIREPPLVDEVSLDADSGGLVECAVKQQHLGNASVPTASRQKSIRAKVRGYARLVADAGHKAQPSDGQWRVEWIDLGSIDPSSALAANGIPGVVKHRAVHRAGKMVLLEIAEQQPIAER